ncbi:hypothetical protein IA64_19980 [Xanthomonas arboricola pv. celebensis]|nr:hypothetical protein IA64_19980 [Xanthomonas arboricola pv. celebensis]
MQYLCVNRDITSCDITYTVTVFASPVGNNRTNTNASNILQRNGRLFLRRNQGRELTYGFRLCYSDQYSYIDVSTIPEVPYRLEHLDI